MFFLLNAIYLNVVATQQKLMVSTDVVEKPQSGCSKIVILLQ